MTKSSTHLYPPITRVTAPNVDTIQAAYYLNRKPQTLRSWACFGNGPIDPIRIHTRLAWPVKRLKEILGVSS